MHYVEGWYPWSLRCRRRVDFDEAASTSVLPEDWVNTLFATEPAQNSSARCSTRIQRLRACTSAGSNFPANNSRTLDFIVSRWIAVLASLDLNWKMIGGEGAAVDYCFQFTHQRPQGLIVQLCTIIREKWRRISLFLLQHRKGNAKKLNESRLYCVTLIIRHQ